MTAPGSNFARHANGLSQRAQWAGGESFVSALMARALNQPELVSLAAGFVDQQTLPVNAVRQAMEDLWRQPDCARAALQYGTTIGYLPLRDAIMDRTLAADRTTARQAGISVQQVVITAGSNQLLYLVSDALLDPGDIVLCGAPTYFVYLGTLVNLGARAVGVDVDEHGLIPESLEEQFERLERAGELGRVKAVYITTYYDNPTGVTISSERRARIVELAKRWSRGNRIYVLEDIAYRELRYHGEEPPSMLTFDAEHDTVVQAGTFSKSFSPGVRVGWGILPPLLIEPVLAAKGNIDFGSPNFNQVLMATVLETGLFDAHVASLRAGYRTKLDAMLEACDEYLGTLEGVAWVRPSGGLYVWIRLPDPVDTGLDGPLFDRAVAEGVLYVPGGYCFPAFGGSARVNMLRLSFGVQACEGIRRGVEALARAVKLVM
ncbi:MAG: PLP-dependent aminotransferase family protein [Patescibacteria group bacterium]|nr:PLP-dependent aminotransferase family protein [Patescibacteria group bacterium]